MEVFLIRHGESEANAGGVHSGWRPVSLTELGRRQAGETGALLSGVEFDRIIVSDLKRARETAELVFPGREYELNSDIREVDTSPLGDTKVADLPARLGEIYLRARAEYDFGLVGCESQAAFLTRTRRFLRRLETLPDRRVAVVTHAGVMRALGSFVMGVPLRSFVPVATGNGAVSVLDYGAKGWRILTWNNNGGRFGR